MNPESNKLQEEGFDLLIRKELRQMSQEEDAHLEEEFEGYVRLYPRDDPEVP